MPSKVKPRAAAAYVRVSHVKQTRRYQDAKGVGGEPELQGGLSFEAQQEQLSQWCTQHGLTIAKEHKFLEIESAADPGDWTVGNGILEFAVARGGFAGVLEVLRGSAVKVLVVQDWDRLARNGVDFHLVKDLIRKFGVEIHSFRDGQIVNANNLPAEDAGLHFKHIIASQESYIRTARVKDGIRHKAEVLRLFVGNRPPYGYTWRRIQGSRKQIRELEVVDEEAELVRWIFELAATGKHGFREMFDLAKARGMFRGSASAARVKDLLTNSVYATGLRWTPPGERTKVTIHPGNNPRIVSDELFFRVQNVMRGQSRTTHKRTQRDHVFVGLIECALCGRRLNPCVPSPSRADRPYWKCPNSDCPGRSKSDSDEVPRHVDHVVVTECVAEYLDAISFKTKRQAMVYANLIAKGRFSTSAEHKAELQTLSAELRAVGKRVKRARTNVLDGDLDEDTRELAKAKLAEAVATEQALSDRMKGLQASLAKPDRAEASEVAATLITSALAMGTRWRKLVKKDQREFLLGILRPPESKEDSLALRFDWARRELVEVRLRPAWAYIAAMAGLAGPEESLRAEGGAFKRCDPGGIHSRGPQEQREVADAAWGLVRELSSGEPVE